MNRKNKASLFAGFVLGIIGFNLPLVVQLVWLVSLLGIYIAFCINDAMELYNAPDIPEKLNFIFLLSVAFEKIKDWLEKPDEKEERNNI